jgi:hypothetical protein
MAAPAAIPVAAKGLPLAAELGISLAPAALSILGDLFGGKSSAEKLSEGGLSKGQLDDLIRHFMNQFGAQQRGNVNILKQATAGQSNLVQRGAVASSQNQMLGNLQKAIEAAVSQSVGAQVEASLGQARIEGINRQSLMQALQNIGLSIGQRVGQK